MSLLIFGRGFVGKATAALFNDQQIAWHDPAQGYEVDSLRSVDRVIICVPTPEAKDGLDHTAVWDCLHMLAARGWSGPIAIRSTCMPAAADSMTDQFSAVMWPEFLRERSALHDAANPHQLVLGGPDGRVHEWRLWLRSQDHAPDAIWHLTDAKTAAMIKLGINAALAAKVMLFNSLHDACATSGADWASVRVGVGLDLRIGSGQSQVPGPDGQRGFGGKCLPKDVGAISAMLPDDDFLQGMIAHNGSLRDA